MIVILGILATVTIFAVRGIIDRGEESCVRFDVQDHDHWQADVYMVDSESSTSFRHAAASDDRTSRR